MSAELFLTEAELNAGLDLIRQSPRDDGRVELIVRRPRTNERELLEVGDLEVGVGLVGDNWRPIGSHESPKRIAEHLDTQLTLMNSRAAALIARTRDRWPLAGDQVFVDLDLSTTNLPPGTRLSMGTAIVEVTAVPHTGCRKFKARFGSDALSFVNSEIGRQLNLRGVNAKVIRGGRVATGDEIRLVQI